jgi:hypothetical protein
VYELYDFSFIFVCCDLGICIYIYRDVICWLAHVLWDDGLIRFICSQLIQSTRRSFSTIEGYNLVATHFHTHFRETPSTARGKWTGNKSMFWVPLIFCQRSTVYDRTSWKVGSISTNQ